MKNPLVNAVLAIAYIFAVALIMINGGHIFPPLGSFFTWIAMLSLLTLSVAVMGSLFIAPPVLLYLDGEKKPAVRLFLGTLGIFALLTLIAFMLVLMVR